MQDADKEDAVLVAITRDGKVFLGSETVPLDQITTRVKSALEKKTDKKVFVKSDARAKYGYVVDVVDNVRSAGVDQLGLLTEQKKGGTPPPPPQKRDEQKPPSGN
jgi:biopolymer transport protein TolR